MSSNLLSEALQEEIRSIVKELLDQKKRYREELPPMPEEALEIKRKVQVIMSKEFITLKEAAFLLGCSVRHLYNLVQKAKHGNTNDPIRYREVDGVTIFHLKTTARMD
jgi:hypothetical protein